MRACTPWSFARERMIHASGANVGGKLSNVETGSFPRRVGKYRECQLPSPSPRLTGLVKIGFAILSSEVDRSAPVTLI